MLQKYNYFSDWQKENASDSKIQSEAEIEICLYISTILFVLYHILLFLFDSEKGCYNSFM